MTKKLKKLKKLKKPKKKTLKPYWDYHEVTHYLEELHGKNFRDYANKFGNKKHYDDKVPYQDFWHSIMDACNGNGSWMYLPDEAALTDPTVEPWRKEILQYYLDFLGKDYNERLWVEW